MNKMSEAEVKAHGLTPRQEEIMGLVADGLTDREIGTALGISEQTVKNHLSQIYIRLSAKNRAHAVFIMLCSSASASPAVPPQQNKTQEIPLTGLLTLSETATFLHAHQNTVRNWSDAGLLKPYRLGPRGDRRFRVDDLRQFLRQSYLTGQQRRQHGQNDSSFRQNKDRYSPHLRPLGHRPLGI